MFIPMLDNYMVSLFCACLLHQKLTVEYIVEKLKIRLTLNLYSLLVKHRITKSFMNSSGWILTKNCARIHIIFFFSVCNEMVPVEKLQFQVTKPILSSKLTKEHLWILSSPQELISHVQVTVTNCSTADSFVCFTLLLPSVDSSGEKDISEEIYILWMKAIIFRLSKKNPWFPLPVHICNFPINPGLRKRHLGS
jgi:hypothetical protein